MIGNSVIYVTTSDKMPKVPHWAIIEYHSMYIDGDERSRTNPGHGYPGHSVEYVSYQAYLSEKDWKDTLEKLANPKFGTKKSFTAMYVIPATIETKIEVNIALPEKEIR